MSTTWVVRSKEETPPKYESMDDYFTLEIHYRDQVEYIDWVDGDRVSLPEIESMIKDAKINIGTGGLKYFWRGGGESLGQGLVPLLSNADVVQLVLGVPESKVLELHVEEETVTKDLDLSGNFSKAERKSLLEDFLESLDGSDPFPEVGDTLCKSSKQKTVKLIGNDKYQLIDEPHDEGNMDNAPSSDGEDEDFKDEDYDFFDDEELDDGLYDLTVDFEAERGFRFQKKSEKELRKKHLSINGEDEHEGPSDDDSDSDRNSCETEYDDSDALLSCYESDEDEDEHTSRRPPAAPEFNVSVDMKDPKFKIGMTFSSKVEFNSAVKVWCINHKYDKLKQARNSRDKMRWVCKVDDCPFFVHAGLLSSECGTWQIKTMCLKHNCYRGFNNAQADYKFLAERYLEQLIDDPRWSLQGILGAVRRELGLEISRDKAWRVRQKALQMIDWDEDEQFKYIRRYGLEVMKQNPGTTFGIKCEDQMFQRLYVCHEPLKRGFLAGCRKVISLDGCFLKGRYGCHLLTAVGIDANDCIYPVAWAIVESENKCSWEWFLTLLAEDIAIENSYHWTFMTDKQKGLIPVINEMFPGSEHRFCVRHMYNNFKAAGHTGKRLKDLLWNAARASHVPDFERWMSIIQTESPAAYEWLNERPAHNWSRSHFTNDVKCDMLLNNLCECFNKFILSAREKPFIACLEQVRVQLMKRIQLKRDAMKKHHGILCPKIEKKVEKIKTESLGYTTIWNGRDTFQVSGFGNQYVVDLNAWTCACRRWELCGIPCRHAVACIRQVGKNVEDYVEDCYKVETYLKIYHHTLNPINGKNLWPTETAPHIKPPPQPTSSRGRRRKARRKTHEEVKELAEKKKKNKDQDKEKWTKRGTAMHCSICKALGHNARSHSKKVGQTAGNLEVPSPINENVPAAHKQQRRPKYPPRRNVSVAAHEPNNPNVSTGKRGFSQPTVAAQPPIQKKSRSST